jgi:ureidoglycolate lyase
MAETANTHTIVAVEATEESFAPYGELLMPKGEALPHVYGDALDTYKSGTFESDAPVQFISTLSRLRPFSLQYLERHHQITQTFVPLGGHAIMLVVAAPDAPLTDSGVPTLESIHAFVVPGDRGANIHRGTWHEVPFPLVDSSLTLVTSHSGVTDGWAHLDEESAEIKRLDEEKRDMVKHLGVEVVIDVSQA